MIWSDVPPLPKLKKLQRSKWEFQGRADYMARRILISGVTSWTGRNTAKKMIENGWEVHGLVRTGSEPHVLRELERLKIIVHSCDPQYESYKRVCDLVRCDAVCHLASAPGTSKIDQIRSLIESNIVFGTELLDAAVQCGCKGIVFAGSYWTHHSGSELAPNSLYAATKIGFRYIVDYYSRFRGIKAIELRLFDSYGANDNRRKFLSWFDQAAKPGSLPVIMTPGLQLLAPIHIDDVTNGLMHACDLAIEGAPGFPSVGCSSYSLPGPQLLTLRKMAELYASVRSTTLNIEWGGRPFPPEQIMEPYLGAILPGWTPSITFETGLRKIYMEPQT